MAFEYSIHFNVSIRPLESMEVFRIFIGTFDEVADTSTLKNKHKATQKIIDRCRIKDLIIN